MRRIPTIFLFALDHWADTKELAATRDRHKSADKKAEVLIDRLLDRALQAPPLFQADVDSATLGKPVHLAMAFGETSRSSLGFRAWHSYPPYLDVAMNWAGYRPQPKKKSMRNHRILAKQLLQFIEPDTGITVKLVGIMHYNPASIQLTASTIQELAEEDKLGSVIVESCDLRWKVESQINQTFWKSEMQIASELAMVYNRPVVLGDRRINVTASRVGSVLKETLSDLLIPRPGWSRIVQNITRIWRDSKFIWGDGYLNAFSFLDVDLLLGVPVAVFKYFVTNTAITPLLLGCVIISGLGPEDAPATQLTSMNDLMILGLDTLQITTIVCLLMLDQVILVERDEILAKNVLEQCRLCRDRKGWSSGRPSFRRRPLNAVQAPESNVVASSRRDDSSSKTVVAVVGMAHCNAIMKRLIERRVD